MQLRPIVSVLLVLSIGCATIDRGPMQRVTIETDPPGASVELTKCGVGNGERTTPVTIMIPRRVTRCSVLLFHDGYEPARILLERKRAPTPDDDVDLFSDFCGDCNSFGAIFLGLAVGGLIYGLGKGVDAAAGANYQLEPRHAQIALVPRGPDSTRDPTRRCAAP